ncbi:DUF3137 domain-containing protein [bacterium]|nr:DUF3137 domain-containing protein [bacterium]
MNQEKDLRALYDEQLKDKLEALDVQRRTIKKRAILFIFGLILARIAYALLPNPYLQWPISIAIALGALVLGGFTLIIYYKYRKVFKNEVVKEIIKLINPDFKYDANRHIQRGVYEKSKIFTQESDRCSGDDYISGNIEKTDFEFSELRSQYKTTTTEDGNTKTEWHNIFKGLFFHADFNKEISGETFVLPDTAEKLFGKIGQSMQKRSSRGELVKLENPEFEKEFVVYSSSQVEARYILTPTMMEAMVNIRRQLKQKFYFSFVGSRVFCAIKIDKAMFEPRIMKTGVSFKDVEYMFTLFSLIETIIHEMNLNTRIWTKN